MADDRLQPGRTPEPLSADLVAQRGFTASFRGYDQLEVREFLGRVADEIRALKDRISELDAARIKAEERAAHPVVDEEFLLSHVGEQTASILRAAHAAAADIRNQAEMEVSGAAEEARQRAKAMLEEAEHKLEEATAEADAAAAELRAAAESDARQLRETATLEATELLDSARQEAESIVEQAARDRRITVDGAQALREKVLSDLSRRRRVATVQIEQLRAGRERLLEAYGMVRRTLEEVNGELQRADAEARAAADAVGRRMADQPADLAEGLPTDPEPLRVLPDGGPAVQDGGEAPAVGAPVGSGTAEPGGLRSSDGGAAAELLAGTATGKEEEEQEEEASGAGGVSAVEAADAGNEPATGSSGVEDEARQTRSDQDEALLQQRDRDVVDTESKLVRMLKRVLQDEQNELLDRLRGARTPATIEVLLGQPAAHAARFAAVAAPLLREIERAGARFANAPSSAPAHGISHGEELAGELAEAITGPLRRRLGHTLSDRAGEDHATLVEALGAVYREWKTQRMERAAGDAVTAAYARGTWDALGAEGSCRWLVDDLDGPCPDCDDNGLAGYLPTSEPFPTGVNHPPAHTGCRCLLVPANP